MNRFTKHRDNAELILAAHGYGHVRGQVLDATYGWGCWWRCWDRLHRVTTITGMDILRDRVPPAGARADFRRPPFRPGTFQTIFFDADYKLNGTPTGPDSKWVHKPADAEVDLRYGAHVRKTWQQRMGDLLDGIANWDPCAWCDGSGLGEVRAPARQVLSDPDAMFELGSANYHVAPNPCSWCAGSGRGLVHGLAQLLEPQGKILVKCMIQVSSGQVRHQPYEVMKRAEAAGLVFVDQFDMEVNPRAQPEGRDVVHAEGNYSTLLIFKKPGRRARAGAAAQA